jgi:hypothetical protein
VESPGAERHAADGLSVVQSRRLPLPLPLPLRCRDHLRRRRAVRRRHVGFDELIVEGESQLHRDLERAAAMPPQARNDRWQLIVQPNSRNAR